MTDLSPSHLRTSLTALAATLAIALPTAYYLLRQPPSPSPHHNNHPPNPDPNNNNTTKKDPHTTALQTFHSFLTSYSTLSPPALTTHLSPTTFTHHLLPTSLSLPPRSLPAFHSHATTIFSLFSSFDMLPQDSPLGGPGSAVNYCPETNTVVAHCRMGGKIDGGSEKGRVLVEQGVQEWWNECVLFVRLGVRGEEVVEVREFVDSARAGELQGRLRGVLGEVKERERGA